MIAKLESTMTWIHVRASLALDVLVAVRVKVLVLEATTLVGEIVNVQLLASVNAVCALNPED